MSDPQDQLVLTAPVKGVFALQIREENQTLLARLLGFDDDEEVPEAHVPPLPRIVEMNSAPFRRLPTDVSH